MKQVLPIVYMACPYSKGDKLYNLRRSMDVWKELYDTGVMAPINPLWSHYQDGVTPMDYEDWLHYDFNLIRACHMMLRLSGESDGADREVEFAMSNDIPVFFQPIRQHWKASAIVAACSHYKRIAEA